MAKIIKVLNHNALIVHDAQNSRALLLLGKGIGFGRRINEQLEIGKAEGCSVYELQQKTSKGETRDVLRSMDPLYLEISAEIVELAERELVRSTATSWCRWQITSHLRSRASAAR